METLVLSERHREVSNEDEKKSETNQKKNTREDDRKHHDKPEHVASKKGRRPMSLAMTASVLFAAQQPSVASVIHQQHLLNQVAAFEDQRAAEALDLSGVLRGRMERNSPGHPPRTFPFFNKI